MSEREKLGKYGNRFRKTYSYRRTPTDIQTYFNIKINQNNTFDLNNVIRDRDYYLIPGLTQNIFGDVAEYEENTITFGFITALPPFFFPIYHYQDTVTIDFVNTFSNVPIVTVDTYVVTDGQGNFVASGSNSIIPYVLNVTTTTLTVGISANAFQTVIRYKAINLPSGDNFPALVTRSPLFPSTTAYISANSVAFASQNNGILNYTDLGVSPTETTISTLDNGNGQSDVLITQDSVNSNTATIDLSSTYTGNVNVIVMRSGSM